MTIDSSKYDSNDKNLDFDFDEWVALLKKCPKLFEERRLQWSEQIIKDAPSSYQRRLSGILFQINMEKRRSQNAIASCIRISKLMWDKVDKLNLELQHTLTQSNESLLNPEQTNIRPLTTQANTGVVYAFPSPVNSDEKY